MHRYILPYRGTTEWETLEHRPMAQTPGMHGLRFLFYKTGVRCLHWVPKAILRRSSASWQLAPWSMHDTWCVLALALQNSETAPLISAEAPKATGFPSPLASSLLPSCPHNPILPAIPKLCSGIWAQSPDGAGEHMIPLKMQPPGCWSNSIVERAFTLQNRKTRFDLQHPI